MNSHNVGDIVYQVYSWRDIFEESGIEEGTILDIIDSLILVRYPTGNEWRGKDSVFTSRQDAVDELTNQVDKKIKKLVDLKESLKWNTESPH